MAKGILIAAMDYSDVADDEFNDWYDTEHLPRLRQDPGLLVAARYCAILGTPRYLALYQLTHSEVVQTDAWRALATTPWTTRMTAFRNNPQRWVFTALPDR